MHCQSEIRYQWRSSVQKSGGGGGTNFFQEKWKAKKKEGHNGVKAQAIEYCW